MLSTCIEKLPRLCHFIVPGAIRPAIFFNWQVETKQSDLSFFLFSEFEGWEVVGDEWSVDY